MTSLSRFSTSPRSSKHIYLGLRRLIALWPIYCGGLLCGCFHLEPIMRPAHNTPPEILEPRSLFSEVVMQSSAINLIVLAIDNDNDQIYFTWVTPPGLDVVLDQVTLPDEGRFYSRLSVRADEALDGKEIRVWVFDDENEVQLVRWSLVSP